MREGLAAPASWASPTSTRAAIEEMPEDCVADAGIFGDILAARMRKRGVAGLVTDGVMRDAGLPVWCDGIAASPVVAALTFVGWQQPNRLRRRRCPSRRLASRRPDGAVVIPADLVEETLEAARRRSARKRGS